MAPAHKASVLLLLSFRPGMLLKLSIIFKAFKNDVICILAQFNLLTVEGYATNFLLLAHYLAYVRCKTHQWRQRSWPQRSWPQILIGNSRYKGHWLFWFSGVSGVFGSLGSLGSLGSPGFLGSLGSLGLWVFWVFGSSGVSGSLVLWVFGSLGLWVFGSLGLWVFGSLGLWGLCVSGVSGSLGLWAKKLKRVDHSKLFGLTFLVKLC